MNYELIAGIVLLVLAVGFLVWQEFKGKNTTQAVVNTVDAKLQASEAAVKAHVTNALSSVATDIVRLATPPAPAVAVTTPSGTPDAAHATLDAQIAAAQQALADLQAKKDAVTKAQQALNEAVGAVK